MRQAYTKTPWAYKKANIPDNVGGFDCCIYDADQKIIAECFQIVALNDSRDSEANASHIVKCVNSHEKLLLACKEAAVVIAKQAEILQYDPTSFPVFNRLISAIKESESETV